MLNKESAHRVAVVVVTSHNKQTIDGRLVPGEYCKDCAVEKSKKAWSA